MPLSPTCARFLSCTIAALLPLVPVLNHSAWAADADVAATPSDFSRICWNGDVEGIGSCVGPLVPNDSGRQRKSAKGDWACSRDNIRKLVWSLQSVRASWDTVGAAGYANAGHNTPRRCGMGSGWRLPTRAELTGIVGPVRAPGPMLESLYFPDTFDQYYWAQDTYTTDPGFSWSVLYGYDGSIAYNKSLPTHVRLVHSARPEHQVSRKRRTVAR